MGEQELLLSEHRVIRAGIFWPPTSSVAKSEMETERQLKMPWRHGPVSRDNLRATFHSASSKSLSSGPWVSWPTFLAPFDLKLALGSTSKGPAVSMFQGNSNMESEESADLTKGKLWSLVWRQKTHGVTELVHFCHESSKSFIYSGSICWALTVSMEKRPQLLKLLSDWGFEAQRIV